MAIIKKSELYKMSLSELETKLFELRRELNSQTGAVASGGRSQNSGKIKQIRRTIARILTLASSKSDINQTDKSQTKMVSKTEVKSSG